MTGALDIILERDGHDQPWGFRLQGGNDIGVPLSVQRVLVGTPADGCLKKGDVLLKVKGKDANALTHQKAVDIFTLTGNEIRLQVLRDGSAPSTPGVTSNLQPGSPLGHSVKSTDLFFSSPKNCFGVNHNFLQQHPTANEQPLTIQNQPYRTTPLIQPGIKVGIDKGRSKKQLGEKVNNSFHPSGGLRSSNISMHSKAYDPLPYVTSLSFTPQQGWNPSQFTGNPTSFNQGSNSPAIQSPLVSPGIKSGGPLSPQISGGLLKQSYNSPINLYSQENVSEVSKLNMMGLNGLNSPTPSTGRITPNKIQPVILTPPKDYDPKISATYQVLQELEPDSVAKEDEVDLSLPLQNEHDPVFSDIFTKRQNSPLPRMSVSPKRTENPLSEVPSNEMENNLADGMNLRIQVPQNNSELRNLTPEPSNGFNNHDFSSQPNMIQIGVPNQKNHNKDEVDTSKLNDEPKEYADVDFPLYDENVLGNKRRIAQSASFNKVMMDVFGI